MLKYVTLLALPFLLFSCADKNEVNIYSSRHYDTDLELFDKFTEETGIEINLIEGSSDELIERINSEGINSPADIVITVDAGRLWRAKEAGILQPYESEFLDSRVDPELRDDEGYWVGLSKRVRAMIYHKERVNPEDLQGYWELGNEQWADRLCIRSSNNIYNQSLVASLIETHGLEETEEWAANLVSNFARSPQGGDTDQVRAVASGLCDVALANHYYLGRLVASSRSADNDVADQVEIYFPPAEYGGAHVNISGAGIAANSPNRDNALRFLEFLATDEAQKIYSIGNMEFPISDDMELPPVLEMMGEFESDAVNVTSYGRNNPDAIRLMDRVGWR